jgi:hypothetical protein
VVTESIASTASSAVAESASAIRRTRLVAASAVVVLLGLLAEVAYAGLADPPLAWVTFFSLSSERNLPTAWSAGLMLLAAWRLLAVARAPAAERPGATPALAWWLLALGFVLMSADEVFELHETLLLRPGEGALYFGWIVPGIALVVALGLLFVPFLRALPAEVRRPFLGSGGLFVGAALGLEVPLGLITEAYGVESLAYALCDWLEEALEILAIAWFAGTLGQLGRPSSATAAATTSADTRGHFIVGPTYDWLWLLSPPLVALAVGIGISGSDFSHQVHMLAGRDLTWAELSLGALIHAHLVAVVVRSHGNADIRRRYPLRFFAVPPLLLGAMVLSPWVAAGSAVLATFWDVFHSGAQTFGFARIYDMRRGNDPRVGRRLDFALNQLLYAGPILAGVTLADHLEAFSAFDDLSLFLSMRAPAMVAGQQGTLARVVFVGGCVFLLLYVAFYARRAREGYAVPWQKVFLLVSTGACSIYCWTWNSWGEAFFVMNLFHAVQYLAFVWAQEGGRLRARLGALGSRPLGAWLVFASSVAAYGLWAQWVEGHVWWCVTIVVSLMHFWYDGFVWSVRRGEIRAVTKAGVYASAASSLSVSSGASSPGAPSR